MVYPIIFPLFIGFQPSKVMQDFFHPQYLLKFISGTAFRTIWSILACGQRLNCACPSFKLRCWPSGWSSCNSKSLPVMCACVASWVIIGRMEISCNHLISLISPRNRRRFMQNQDFVLIGLMSDCTTWCSMLRIATSGAFAWLHNSENVPLTPHSTLIPLW